MSNKMPPEYWYFNVAPEFKRVSRKEFDRYLDGYPRKLRFDAYGAYEPALLTWNDFELADRWPYSIVARTYAYYDETPEEERSYYIVENIDEVYANRTGKTAEEWAGVNG